MDAIKDLDFLLLLTIDHKWKDLVWLLESRVWFASSPLALKIFTCMTLTLRMLTRHFLTHSQFDCMLVI